ncbi:hypothetical protein [Bathymodiolus platifrons methanotrophic gill symbiont]|uniref:hypothetical protein n=1 Tax=Bathymodiolus platifrons methanotrophic gill symbiont TaxID=113268 RepID=UPI001C8F0B29|nr:hypothetical protein [Bathymodiolus platifrons methanotrophic gill symbiont]
MNGQKLTGLLMKKCPAEQFTTPTTTKMNSKMGVYLSKMMVFDSSSLFLARQSVNHKGLIRVNPDASTFSFSAGDNVADARHVNDVLLSWIDSDRRLLVVFPGEIVQNICQNNNYCRGHNDCK